MGTCCCRATTYKASTGSGVPLTPGLVAGATGTGGKPTFRPRHEGGAPNVVTGYKIKLKDGRSGVIEGVPDPGDDGGVASATSSLLGGSGAPLPFPPLLIKLAGAAEDDAPVAVSAAELAGAIVDEKFCRLTIRTTSGCLGSCCGHSDVYEILVLTNAREDLVASTVGDWVDEYNFAGEAPALPKNFHLSPPGPGSEGDKPDKPDKGSQPRLSFDRLGSAMKLVLRGEELVFRPEMNPAGDTAACQAMIANLANFVKEEGGAQNVKLKFEQDEKEDAKA
eukprot:g5585.t1